MDISIFFAVTSVILELQRPAVSHLKAKNKLFWPFRMQIYSGTAQIGGTKYNMFALIFDSPSTCPNMVVDSQIISMKWYFAHLLSI